MLFSLRSRNVLKAWGSVESPIAFASKSGRSMRALAAANAYGPPDPIAATETRSLQRGMAIDPTNSKLCESMMSQGQLLT